MTTTKENLKKSAEELKDLFSSTFNLDLSKISLEIESKDIDNYQLALTNHKKIRTSAKISIKYNLETKTLDIVGNSLELFYFGFYYRDTLENKSKL